LRQWPVVQSVFCVQVVHVDGTSALAVASDLSNAQLHEAGGWYE
jgi:hypothetical protein